MSASDKDKAPGVSSGKQSGVYRPAAFNDLTDKELLSLYNAARIRKYNANDIIITQGDESRSLFIILEGSVDVLRNFDGVSRKIDYLARGSVIGEVAFVRKIARSATVVAAEPCRMMEITEAAFDSLPLQTQLNVFKSLAALAADRVEKMINMSFDAVEEAERVYEYVYRIKKKTAGVLDSGIIQELLQKIPKLPRYATDLTVKLMDERTTPQEVADSIKADPSLAGLVLKIVNSPFYGLPQKVSDLNRAVVLLGFNGVYQIVIGEGVKSTMPKTEEFEKLQTRSYLTSLIAYEVSQFTNREKAGVNSTVGLLHGLGKSIILLLKRKNPKISALIDTLDDSRLGAALLRNWELPERVFKVVEYQHFPEFTPPHKVSHQYINELATLYIARVCAEYLMENDAREASTAYFDDYTMALNLPRQSPKDFFNNRVIPVLLKNENRLPAEVRAELRQKTAGIA